MEPIAEREPGDVRILWGRVAALGGALFLAFLLGTWVAGDDGGVDEEELNQLRTELESAREENEELSEYIDELSAGQAERDRPSVDDDSDDTEDADSDDDEADDTTSDSSDVDGQIYTVRSGDSLTGIAERFYGNTDEYERIVEANDLDRDTPLQVGQELIIPPAED